MKKLADAKATRREQIVEIFNSLDEPASVKELTVLCVNKKLWSKEDCDRAAFRGFEAEVRTALNDMDIDGCPISLIRAIEIESFIEYFRGGTGGDVDPSPLPRTEV